MDNNSNQDIKEVPFPGIGDTEQPTILEILNRRIADEATPTTETTAASERSDSNVHNAKLDGSTEKEQLVTPDNDNLVKNRVDSNKDTETRDPQQRIEPTEEEGNVLEIESHLIETFNTYSVREGGSLRGVDINELPPSEVESSHTTSRIETDALIGSVFEVEPAIPKVFQPVETIFLDPEKYIGLKEIIKPPESESNSTPNSAEKEKEISEDEVREDVRNSQTESTALNSSKPAWKLVIEIQNELESHKNQGDSNRVKQSEDCVDSSHNSENNFGGSDNLVDIPPTQHTNSSTDVNKPDIVGIKYKPNVEDIDQIEATFVRNESLKPTTEELFPEKADQVQSNELRKPLTSINETEATEPNSEQDTTTKEPINISGLEKPLSEIHPSLNTDQIQSEKLKLDYESKDDPIDLSDTSGTTKLSPKSQRKQITEQTNQPADQTESPNLTQSCHKPLNETNSTDNEVVTNLSQKNETSPNTEEDGLPQNTTKQLSTDIKTEFLITPTALDDKDSVSLTEEIDQKLYELSTHLTKPDSLESPSNLDINGLPLPRTPLEEEQRKQFLDSLPQITAETDSNKVASLAKREYYQSLRQYLVSHSDRPPVPPETYRWEDLRRAKQRGGYPWTHLYKRPLGPDEEPEIVLLLRKSQELRFASESPKSIKKVRIDDQVSIKETERYIQELSDTEDNPEIEIPDSNQEDDQSECISCVSDSVLTVEKRTSKLGKIRGILKKRSGKSDLDSRSLPDTSPVARSTLNSVHKSEEDVHNRRNDLDNDTHHKPKCFPIMKKLRSMADRQKQNFRNIKKITLKKDEKISLEEEQKIIKLKTSPKAKRSEIPHFIEKQDSDDVMEIVELDESPSRKRNYQLELQEQAAAAESSVLVPDEIIEIPESTNNEEDTSERQQTPEPTVSEILEEEFKSNPEIVVPPKKTKRLRREHVYEDIDDEIPESAIKEEIDNIIEVASVEALKESLAKQDASTLQEVESKNSTIPLDRMGSSEDEVERSHLAPISSIESASSEDDRKQTLPPVTEESTEVNFSDKEEVEAESVVLNDIELKPALKKEASPAPSEKKVTFSHIEDEAEPHREDIALPEDVLAMAPKRWSNISDHEYEPIGEPSVDIKPSEDSHEKVPSTEVLLAPQVQQTSDDNISTSPENQSSEAPQSESINEIEQIQKNIEDHYFRSATTTPHSDYDVHTSQVDSSALEELPLKPENRKKGFMASAQDRTRKMQEGLRSQADWITTKLRTTKKPPSGSPRVKERKRFKTPKFSQIKMPEIKRPDLSGFKRPDLSGLKRPKFNKPDMSKFKLPLKLSRSKSMKEPSECEDTTASGATPESALATTASPSKKPKFDFTFNTYPRAFKKKKKVVEESSVVDEPSVIPSTETQPSADSSSTPQGDRGPGPVRSRWADKFSDVSYNDSEGSRYRRYGSEQESSFDRESSMERRMKEVLEENAKEEAELAVLSVVEQKQFADYDEENRAIHEISKTREGEFKRRPIVHQDSDLISEEGRDIGWTQKEAERNQILRQTELEAEAHLRYLSERQTNPETQSTASSKKFVFEEINPDEFLLRKKGISQEFNIGNQRFLDPQLEAAFTNTPNALEFLGSKSGSVQGNSMDRIDYEYDIPPPKPRRLSHQPQKKSYDYENNSQIGEFIDDISLSQADGDQVKTHPPLRPLRRGRSIQSQNLLINDNSSAQFYDEEPLEDEMHQQIFHDDEEKENIALSQFNDEAVPPPKAPRRRRKLQRESLEKHFFINGFGGRSVSNSYLKEENKPDEVIVYRTEHEYKIPLATTENYTDTTNSPRKSRSLSRLGIEEDDRTSIGADSLALDTSKHPEIDNINVDDEEMQEKYIIEMMENDGYAIVRKENLPKPTPPARRKRFARSPGERFATMPHQRKPSPMHFEQSPVNYNVTSLGRPIRPRRRSATSLGANSQKDIESEDFLDYEIPDNRTESPRNLQSGEIINKMKYRPLPPPPLPPREKRHSHRSRHSNDDDDFDRRDDRDGGAERITSHDYLDDYDLEEDADKSLEVEVSTQTDPLPDDFVCEEFEITDDMRIIEPRRTKTLDEILKEEEEADLERARQIDEEVLLRGIQRFREANQRSISEKSRASSQAKSLSRPETPSAILIEKRIPTPVSNGEGQTVLEASLTVQPIDDLDLEEELLRREGLYEGSHTKSDTGSRYRDDEDLGHESEEENAKIGEDEVAEEYNTNENEVEDEYEDEDRIQALLEEEQRILEQLEKHRLKEEQLIETESNQELEEKEAYIEHTTDEEFVEHQIADIKKEFEKSQTGNKEESILPPITDSITHSYQSYIKQEDEAPLREYPPEPSPSPPPTAPPRKRSYAAGLYEEQPEPNEYHQPTATSTRPNLSENLPSTETTVSKTNLNVTDSTSLTERQPLTTMAPSHLSLADLEVERLRVHALQAGEIMVSQLHGSQITTDELECRSGNLVVQNIELPPRFIDEIVERLRNTEREHSQVATQTTAEQTTETESQPPPPVPRRQSDEPPLRPPLPQTDPLYSSEYTRPSTSDPLLLHHDHEEVSIHPRRVFATEYMQPSSSLFSQHPIDEDDEPVPHIVRRRRYHRRRDSSSEDDHHRRRSRSSRPEQQSISQAGRQFVAACCLPLVSVLNQLTNIIRGNADNKNGQSQRRNSTPVIVLFIIIIFSLLCYMLTGRNIHHHHWDFFNPPGNNGRLS